MGPNEQNQHFAELRQKSMFIHTRLSPKRFAKSMSNTNLLYNKKEEKTDSQTWVRQTIVSLPTPHLIVPEKFITKSKSLIVLSNDLLHILHGFNCHSFVVKK